MKNPSQNESVQLLKRRAPASKILVYMTLMILPLFYQNCGSTTSGGVADPASASPDDSNGASGGGSGTGTGSGSGSGSGSGTVVTNPSTGQQTICDPFSDNKVCGNGEGLLGNIYSLQGGGPDVQTYIDKGVRLPSLIQLTNLNIPRRAWTDGFPGPGGKLKDENGNDLIEHFAFDLRGFITLTSDFAAGDYQFATHSDDGTILDLDAKEVVNNDGQHAMQWKCSSTPVFMSTGTTREMRLRYYQGPRVEIGLQVYMRPWADASKPCNTDASWKIVPADMLTY